VLWSRTPGKYLKGLAVVDAAGGRCGWRRALVRTVVKVVEANPLLFGGIPAGVVILVSRRNQRLGNLPRRHAGRLGQIDPGRPLPFSFGPPMRF